MPNRDIIVIGGHDCRLRGPVPIAETYESRAVEYRKYSDAIRKVMLGSPDPKRAG